MFGKLIFIFYIPVLSTRFIEKVEKRTKLWLSNHLAETSQLYHLKIIFREQFWRRSDG